MYLPFNNTVNLNLINVIPVTIPEFSQSLPLSIMKIRIFGLKPKIIFNGRGKVHNYYFEQSTSKSGSLKLIQLRSHAS